MPGESARTHISAQVTRWGAVIATGLMGCALMLNAVSTYQGVQRASGTLVRGQADVFLDRLRGELYRLRHIPNQDELKAILEVTQEAHAADGLVYLCAAMDGETPFTIEVGAPGPERLGCAEAVRDLKPDTQVRVGERIRTLLPKPRPPEGRRAPPRRPRPTILIEFEPRQSDQLMEAARLTLGIGGVASLVFLIVAIALFRWSLRRHERERELEHERRLASLGEMSAVLAHEIRNPLASLKGNAQLLVRALPDGERLHRRASRVVNEATRLERLTNDLLEFVRTGAIERTHTDPRAVLREAAEASGHALVTIGDNVPETWPMDRGRIRQVLVNLLMNAAQQSDEVEASLTFANNALVYEVRDHGEGIEAEDLPKLFEPFFTRRTKGTGLGLAVSQRLVQLHGGRLEAENPPGGGALFRATLPTTPER